MKVPCTSLQVTVGRRHNVRWQKQHTATSWHLSFRTDLPAEQIINLKLFQVQIAIVTTTSQAMFDPGCLAGG